jgi:circadian clock protein KaiC
VRRALSCIKKRTGSHETTIREFRIGVDGLAVDEPLTQFQGVLQGIPNLLDVSPRTLLE